VHAFNLEEEGDGPDATGAALGHRPPAPELVMLSDTGSAVEAGRTAA
jgi:hypothetical protein